MHLNHQPGTSCTCPAVPPKGVRAVMRDGTVVPVALIYMGQGLNGIHEWEVLDCPPPNDIASWHFDEMPARTAIALPIAQLD